MAAFTASLRLPSPAAVDGSNYLQRAPPLVSQGCWPLKREGRGPAPRIVASAVVAPSPTRQPLMLAPKELAGAISGYQEEEQPQQVDQLKLLTTYSSPYGMRVLVALHEKGLQFEYEEEVLRSFSPKVMLANPVHKKVPVLIHNGQALAESRIIMEYLDEQWPASPSSSPSRRGNLLPASPLARAQARFWADFVDSQFFLVFHDVLVTNGETQRLAIEKSIQHLHRIDRDALKMHTPDSFASFKKRGPYFNNESSIGFFDITFVGILQWLRALEVITPFKMPNARKCPRLNAWIDAISEEPSVQKSMPTLELLVKRGQASRCRRDFDDWNTLYTSSHLRDQTVHTHRSKASFKPISN